VPKIYLSEKSRGGFTLVLRCFPSDSAFITMVILTMAFSQMAQRRASRAALWQGFEPFYLERKPLRDQSGDGT